MKRFIYILAACLLGMAGAGARADDAGSLQGKYGELREQLRNNSFNRALYIDSTESGDTIRGDVYAVLDHPFKTVSQALKDPGEWCDIMILPFNTKYCHATEGAGAPMLDVRIGRKVDQPVQEAYRINFAMHQVAATGDYFESRLTAASGPVGTKNYRIAVSAVPLDSGKTFMHLSYSYGYGFAGKVAMQAYLSTAGASKVGFTVTGKDGNGEPIYIGGSRGAIERNAMRYYLAIDAHLASLSLPQDQRLEKRITTWFNNSEKYAKQLHEMDRAQYLAMKRGEYERAQVAIQ